MNLIEHSKAVLCNAQFCLACLPAGASQRPIELLSGSSIGQHSYCKGFGVVTTTLAYRKAMLCAE